MVRLLSVIDSLTGSGGAEQGLVRETTRFSADVHSHVVRLFTAGGLEERLETAGIGTQTLGMDARRAGRNWPVAVRRLGPIIESFGPDVVQTSLFASNLVGQVAARRADVPVLSNLVLSGDPRLLRAYQPGADSLRAGLLRRIGGLAARSDLVWFRALTVDALETNAALLGIDPSRGTVIPRGVPLPPTGWEPRSRAEVGLPEDVPLLVNVGRQTAQKGQWHLVDVLEAVRTTVPAHLVVLGREAEKTALLRNLIADRGLGDHVTIIAYTPHVADVLAHADVFVFPSHMEGLGTAVLEAMAAGLPVVAFDIPPVSEATDAGRYARLVPVGDVAAMIDEVRWALDEGDQLGAAGRAWVERTFSIDVVAERVEALLVAVATGTVGS